MILATMMMIPVTLVSVLLAITFTGIGAEVIDLDNSNFEHLTQASTGATTGDWLVKFYASWCGHCKKLEPIYEKVADMLDGEINVARVDVPKNRDLGTRFEIKGFPTLKFISKGKVYHYKGRRTVEDIIEFVRGGFEIHEPEEVNPPMGMFGEIMHVYRSAYKQAGKDLRNGRYFTMEVFLTFVPFIFLALIFILIFAPVPEPAYVQEAAARKRREERLKQQQRNEQRGATDSLAAGDAAPPTSELDESIAKKDK